MKAKLASTLAVALVAASSFAFAADNSGGKDGKDGMMNDPNTTGSIEARDPTEPPDQKTIDDCKTAPADDVNCQNILSR
ncbi:MAG: hypothetical protein KL863_03820 [Rhizobium sp.]|nr:hypothetical protein [Rhizobium sp.]